ncbi:MAG: GspH/FimT family protein [bacterium]
MIYYDLHYARMAAIKGRNRCRIIFDTTSDHIYQIHHDLDSDGKQDAGESVIHKDIDKQFKGIRFSSNKSTASYSPFGTSNGGTITVKNGPEIKKVIFSREGRVRIE